MFFGSGVLKGLSVTIKNFFNSFSKSADNGGIFTAQYPEQPLPKKEAFRNLPFLIYDNEPLSVYFCSFLSPPSQQRQWQKQNSLSDPWGETMKQEAARTSKDEY